VSAAVKVIVRDEDAGVLWQGPLRAFSQENPCMSGEFYMDESGSVVLKSGGGAEPLLFIEIAQELCDEGPCTGFLLPGERCEECGKVATEGVATEERCSDLACVGGCEHGDGVHGQTDEDAAAEFLSRQSDRGGRS
jgi:hypothetical protein